VRIVRPGAAPLTGRRLALCDEDLDEAVAGLLAHDGRVAGLAVRGRADGGVVHLTGEVDEARQLALLRGLVGRLAGVHAVWDRVRIGGRDPVVLDLGCGDQRQYPESVGVDRRRTPSAAVVADLAAPLPFADASADRVFLVHVLEHLADFLPLVDECHRVLRPGGVLHLLSPWWKHVNAVADPTHVRFLDTQTVKGVCAQAGRERRWYPLHVSCDGASVFADLTPTDRDVPASVSARFFD
jgi:SAM-dependent methyltransferase